MNPFESIYRWFISFFGDDLADHLAGFDCQEEAYTGNNLYIPIGIVAVIISLAVMLLYYYAINSAKLNKWQHWIIALLFAGVVNLFTGYKWTAGELPNIGECLNTSMLHCWFFGMANAFIAIIFFIIFSFALRFWSRNCCRTPF
jgi:hypothetical protein